MAERTGLEPATPGVTGRYSNQLNYRSAGVVQHRICASAHSITKIFFWEGLCDQFKRLSAVQNPLSVVE